MCDVVLFPDFVLIPRCGIRGRWQSLRAYLGTGVAVLFGGGGSGAGAPDYTDAFSTGFGFGGEYSWRFCRWFSGVGGLGFERYDGDTYEGITFSDLEIVPVYAGGKIHLVPDTALWDFYLRMDVGVAYLSSVNVSYGSLQGRYWDASWVFLFDVGVGTEYRWDRWGVSLDVKARYLGSPDSAMGDLSEADASWTLPVVLGINYHF